MLRQNLSSSRDKVPSYGNLSERKSHTHVYHANRFCVHLENVVRGCVYSENRIGFVPRSITRPEDIFGSSDSTNALTEMYTHMTRQPHAKTRSLTTVCVRSSYAFASRLSHRMCAPSCCVCKFGISSSILNQHARQYNLSFGTQTHETLL